MALWPFSRDYFMSPCPSSSRCRGGTWLPGFWLHNVKVGLSELLIFGTFAALVWRRTRRRGKAW